jgi:hypothetical protein
MTRTNPVSYSGNASWPPPSGKQAFLIHHPVTARYAGPVLVDVYIAETLADANHEITFMDGDFFRASRPLDARPYPGAPLFETFTSFAAAWQFATKAGSVKLQRLNTEEIIAVDEDGLTVVIGNRDHLVAEPWSSRLSPLTDLSTEMSAS